MSTDFDPYHIWLGIPPDERPPTYYRLLGIRIFEENVDVIQNAAIRHMAHVNSFTSGPHAFEAQNLLSELTEAAETLLSASLKHEYDQRLNALMNQAPPPAPDDYSSEFPDQVAETPPATESFLSPSSEFDSPTNAPAKARKKTYKPYKPANPVLEVIKIALGGIAGIACAVLILLFYADIDLLGLREKGWLKKETAKDDAASSREETIQPQPIPSRSVAKHPPAVPSSGKMSSGPTAMKQDPTAAVTNGGAVATSAKSAENSKIIQNAEQALRRGTTSESLYDSYVNALIGIRKPERAEHILAKGLMEFPQAVALRKHKLQLVEFTIPNLVSHDRMDLAEARVNEAQDLLADMKRQFPIESERWNNLDKLLSIKKRQIDSMSKFNGLLGKPAMPLEPVIHVSGPARSPESLKGKVVLLDFWAVWSEPSIATFPQSRKWHESYASRGLVIVGATPFDSWAWNIETNRPERRNDVTPDGKRDATRDFTVFHNLKYTNLVLPDNQISNYYFVDSLPHFVIIDRAGKIRQIRNGGNLNDVADLEKTILECLAEDSTTES